MEFDNNHSMVTYFFKGGFPYMGGYSQGGEDRSDLTWTPGQVRSRYAMVEMRNPMVSINAGR